MYIGLHVKYPNFCQILIAPELILSPDFLKILQSNFLKIHRVGAEFFHVDRQMDKT